MIGRGDLDQLSDVKCGNAKLFGIAELAEWPWVFIGADDHVFALEGAHARATFDAGPVKNEFGDWNSLSRINLLLASRTTLVSQSRFHLFLFQTLLLFLPAKCNSCILRSGSQMHLYVCYYFQGRVTAII